MIEIPSVFNRFVELSLVSQVACERQGLYLLDRIDQLLLRRGFSCGSSSSPVRLRLGRGISRNTLSHSGLSGTRVSAVTLFGCLLTPQALRHRSTDDIFGKPGSSAETTVLRVRATDINTAGLLAKTNFRAPSKDIIGNSRRAPSTTFAGMSRACPEGSKGSSSKLSMKRTCPASSSPISSTGAAGRGVQLSSSSDLFSR